MSTLPKINVIIRSTVEAGRRRYLLSAIESIHNQQHVNAIPIVVANGDIFHRPTLESLERNPAIRFIHIEKASTGRAMRIGREMVDTPFFTFLDDDDQLLPNSLKIRLYPLLIDSKLDLVVSTGFETRQNGWGKHIDNILKHQDDPLYGLIKRNWMAPCGGIFRSSSIPIDYFDGVTDYHEWTLLAFKIAYNHHAIKFLDIPTYVKLSNHHSLSKTAEYNHRVIDVLEQMRRYQLPEYVSTCLEIKYRNALHNLSNMDRLNGNINKAWKLHFRSLKPPHTLKYLAFTRKLIWSTLHAH